MSRIVTEILKVAKDICGVEDYPLWDFINFVEQDEVAPLKVKLAHNNMIL